jgi:hypothetical protein
MHLAAEERKGQPTGWRISLDRAWRSRQVRRTFEAETGLAPLAGTAADKDAQTALGDTETYHDRFLLWATRHFGLEDQAPAAIQKKLSITS